MGSFRSVLTLSPGRLTVGYLAVGAGWLLLTDRVIAGLVDSPRFAVGVETAGVWLFVAVSGLLVFGLSRHHRRRIEESQSRLRTANQQLQVLHRVFRHNVRNDLNVIQGYATVVADDVEGDQSSDSLETISQTARRLVDVSEKLKVVHKVEPTRADESHVDLVPILREELETVQAAHPDVTVETSTPESARIVGDGSLAFAIREVLENAIEHHDSPEEGTLEVDLCRCPDGVVLEIADDGPGIPPEELEALRRETETQLAHASSIGLWLVTWVCRLHGGTVEFTSEPGEGTSVRMHFREVPERSILERIGMTLGETPVLPGEGVSGFVGSKPDADRE
ncbi:sensor histidine kinase [Natrialbaceae archaeon A-gly3]